jgi:hypothetical protein
MANGQFGTLVRSTKEKTKKVNIKDITSENLEDYTFIGKSDKRMRFNNSKDPIYYVFDVIDNRPIQTLAKEFVRDSFFDAVNFVVKAVR